MARKKAAFVSGTTTNDPLASGGTTLNSAGLSSLPEVVAPDIAVIVLDPTGSAGAPEVVWVTAHTAAATSATILRAQEGTVARAHAVSTAWIHGPTIVDIEEEPAVALERLVLGSTSYKTLGHLGPTTLGCTSTSVTIVQGIGFYGFCTSSATIAHDITEQATAMVTGATGGAKAAYFGVGLVAAKDPVFHIGVKAASVADLTAFFGFAAAGVDPVQDHSNSIGFRIAGTGNVVAYCDSGGTETTRDTGATAATYATYSIVISGGGTIVRFYKNNVQIGADVTTNIYASSLAVGIGISNNGAASSKTMYVRDATYWQVV